MKAEKHGLLIFVLLLFSFCVTSCASKGASVIVPNERDVVLQNLSSEYLSIADSYMDLKKYSKAVEFYLKSLSIDSGNSLTVYQLAKAYTLNKQWTEAEVLYKQLLSADPQNSSLRLSLAYIYAQSDALDKAVSLYQELYEENPLNTNVLVNYGLILVHEDNLEMADKLLKELTEISENGEGTRKLSQAITEAEKAKEEPNQSEAESASET